MKTVLIFTRAISKKKKKVRFLSSAKHFKMSSTVLDKHVDSFGPKLLNEAWRGTVCSFSRPGGGVVFFLPSLRRAGGVGTGIRDSR